MRLSIDLSPQQHHELKTAAAREGKTIKDYLLQRVLPNAGVSGPAERPELEPARNSGSARKGQGGRASKSVEEIFEEMMRDEK